MSRFLVGLTGGMASGKSTVARWLAEAGFLVIDADRLVAELYAPGGAGAQAVHDLFGAECLNADGSVDHSSVASRVFADDQARKQLEGLIHPLVRQSFRAQASEARGVVVLEATLMVESGHYQDFDLVLSVESDETLRLERAVARGMDRAAAAARLRAQGDGSRRRAGADRLLMNNGSLDDLRRRVDNLIRELMPKHLAGQARAAQGRQPASGD